MGRASDDSEANPIESRIADRVHSRLGARVRAIESMAAGLGHRLFFRVHLEPGEGPASLIARLDRPAPAPADADLGWLPEPALEPIRGFLEAGGIPVPRLYDHADGPGPSEALDLLEDLGETSLLDALPSLSPDERWARFREAAGWTPRLQRLAAPAGPMPAFDRRFDRALLATKRLKLERWAWPALLGRAASPAEARTLEEAWTRIGERVLRAPMRLAHRDFKAENLHFGSGPPGASQGDRPLVLIDVQGAFLAPPEYDLVCLLHDMQTDAADPWVERLFDEIRPEWPDAPPADESKWRFAALTFFRVAKDLAHVVHAAVDRGDRRRLGECPRALRLIEEATTLLAVTDPRDRALHSVIETLTREGRDADIPRTTKPG